MKASQKIVLINLICLHRLLCSKALFRFHHSHLFMLVWNFKILGIKKQFWIILRRKYSAKGTRKNSSGKLWTLIMNMAFIRTKKNWKKKSFNWKKQTNSWRSIILFLFRSMANWRKKTLNWKPRFRRCRKKLQKKIKIS